MAERADAVLAAIPVLAVGGVWLGWAVRYLEATVGVGGRLAPVPFAALGIVGAAVVIGHELATGPNTGGRDG